MQSMSGQGQYPQQPFEPQAPASQQPPMWGLAADLAQGGGQQQPEPHGRYPEFGAEQDSQLQQDQRPQPRLKARPAMAGPVSQAYGFQQQQPAAFGLHSDKNQPQAERQPYNGAVPSAAVPPYGASGAPAPYGLALELTRGGPLNPLHVHPGTAAPAHTRGAKRTLNPQLAEAGWSAAPIVPPGAMPQQHDMQQQYTAASRPEEEPDYGFVAELKQAGPADPLAARDFGLAAEVARRRGGALPPLGGQYGSTASASLPPLRPRKRLAAAGPPANFGMSQEIAERQAQFERDRIDPFNAANRASGQDPFIMADDVLKFPTTAFEPQPPKDQELVEGPVPLKVPHEGDASTNAVSGDGRTYGIASELGAEEAWQRQQAEMAAASAQQQMGGPMSDEEAQVQGPSLEELQRQQLLELLEWEPSGHKYVYNEETGMLQTTEGGEGTGGRVARAFIEDGATGNFYNLNDPGLWRRITRFFERKSDLDDYDDGPEKGFRAGLRTAVFQVSNFFSMFGIFIQALLGGFALLNFFLTYLLYNEKSAQQFLQYYSPDAMQFSRAYFTLTTFSVIAATARFCRDQLRGFQPRRLRLKYVDGAQVLVYVAAYICTVFCTPLDDELTYEYDRNPLFYQMTFNSKFITRLATWHTLNLLRIVFSAVGLLLLCYQHSPHAFEHTVKYEAHQRLKAILMPKAMFDPVMAMAPPETVVTRRHTMTQPGG